MGYKNIISKYLKPVLGRFVNAINYNLQSPIFIIGTGRCGTTLLVKILESHPEVLGYPSEANELWHPHTYPETTEIEPIELHPKEFTEYSISTWPKNHEKTIRRTFDGFRFLTGRNKTFFAKSAMLSFMIPKILEIYPDARFIHIYRNAMSVVNSYFNKNYNKYDNYEYDKEEYYLACAEYWNDCILEIDRQKEILNAGSEKIIYEFSYESLCDRPEEVLKELAKFMNINKDEFNFDLSKIDSKNYKVSDKESYLSDLIHEKVQTGMEIKNYI